MPSCPPSLSLLVVKPPPPVVEVDSSHSFVRDNRKHPLILLSTRLSYLGFRASEITITLRNQGDEAYKPHEYGKSIQITRRFTKEGSSTWKIKGTKSKNTVSSKREELSAICDHMNIQVDNPLNVLTQGSLLVICCLWMILLFIFW